MKPINQQAYDVIVAWSEEELASAADALVRDDKDRALREIDVQVEFLEARLRAYIALRECLRAELSDRLIELKEKDPTDNEDWT